MELKSSLIKTSYLTSIRFDIAIEAINSNAVVAMIFAINISKDASVKMCVKKEMTMLS